MGALTRATFVEVEELHAGNAEWWPAFCAEVAEKGQAAVLETKDAHGWAAGALWKWIVKDEKRFLEYRQALEFYVSSRVFATSAVVDAGPEAGADVARDGLRVKQAFALAEKVDPANWGAKGVGGGGEVKVVLVNFVQGSDGRVIEQEADTARVAVNGNFPAAQVQGD